MAPPGSPLQLPQYVERQVAARCGLHALNNALGEAVFTAPDLSAATDQVLFETNLPPVEGAAPPEPTLRRQHELPSGWYSEEVLAMALLSTFQFAFDQTPAHDRLWVLNDVDVVGALVNLPRQHWMALRCFSGEVWLFDSLAAGPRHIGPWDGPA
ncbi:MAG: hypothetical protein GY772_01375, partial [bacterium]|nr:hypothetical protein [bacterium]